MIYKKQLKQFLKRTFKLENCFTLKILTFKKDRYLLISYDQERYIIVEDGFERRQYQCNSSDEAMKKVMKRGDIEFKHSYRLYTKLKKE
ncbi:hypothetical protein RV14_GL000860 [Enterococcus ratti]|uniref:Uncharacterized protein n=2 Tax=Enterococcus ratti TaxID=150033 RepID=A0A1L8WEG6_9ENTE|nr:hypothetical protein RV14_GL000860 [Enterococcus ratti]